MAHGLHHLVAALHHLAHLAHHIHMLSWPILLEPIMELPGSCDSWAWSAEAKVRPVRMALATAKALNDLRIGRVPFFGVVWV